MTASSRSHGVSVSNGRSRNRCVQASRPLRNLSRSSGSMIGPDWCPTPVKLEHKWGVYLFAACAGHSANHSGQPRVPLLLTGGNLLASDTLVPHWVTRGSAAIDSELEPGRADLPHLILGAFCDEFVQGPGTAPRNREIKKNEAVYGGELALVQHWKETPRCMRHEICNGHLT